MCAYLRLKSANGEVGVDHRRFDSGRNELARTAHRRVYPAHEAVSRTVSCLRLSCTLRGQRETRCVRLEPDLRRENVFCARCMLAGPDRAKPSGNVAQAIAECRGLLVCNADRFLSIQREDRLTSAHPTARATIERLRGTELWRLHGAPDQGKGSRRDIRNGSRVLTPNMENLVFQFGRQYHLTAQVVIGENRRMSGEARASLPLLTGNFAKILAFCPWNGIRQGQSDHRAIHHRKFLHRTQLFLLTLTSQACRREPCCTRTCPRAVRVHHAILQHPVFGQR